VHRRWHTPRLLSTTPTCLACAKRSWVLLTRHLPSLTAFAIRWAYLHVSKHEIGTVFKIWALSARQKRSDCKSSTTLKQFESNSKTNLSSCSAVVHTWLYTMIQYSAVLIIKDDCFLFFWMCSSVCAPPNLPRDADGLLLHPSYGRPHPDPDLDKLPVIWSRLRHLLGFKLVYHRCLQSAEAWNSRHKTNRCFTSLHPTGKRIIPLIMFTSPSFCSVMLFRHSGAAFLHACLWHIFLLAFNWRRWLLKSKQGRPTTRTSEWFFRNYTVRRGWGEWFSLHAVVFPV